jgi:hypothetical protein
MWNTVVIKEYVRIKILHPSDLNGFDVYYESIKQELRIRCIYVVSIVENG